MARKLKVKRSEGSGKIPVGVKVVSILYYIGAVLAVLFGVLIMIGSNVIVSYLITNTPELSAVRFGTLVTLAIVLGIVMIGIGIFSFVLGRGIWRLKQWARIVAIVLSILGLLSAIISIVTSFAVSSVANFIIEAYIAGYLLFNKEVKKIFK